MKNILLKILALIIVILIISATLKHCSKESNTYKEIKKENVKIKTYKKEYDSLVKSNLTLKQQYHSLKNKKAEIIIKKEFIMSKPLTQPKDTICIELYNDCTEKINILQEDNINQNNIAIFADSIINNQDFQISNLNNIIESQNKKEVIIKRRRLGYGVFGGVGLNANSNIVPTLGLGIFYEIGKF